MSIGETLQQVRNQNNLTQEEVAAKMFVTRQTISRWEQGKTIPNIYALQDLAKLYNVNLSDLTDQSFDNPKVEEGRKMNKINWLALFGLFWWNLIVTLGVVLAVGGIMVGLWVADLTFIISPILLVLEWFAAGVIHVIPWSASLTWYQEIPLAIVLCAVGFGGFNILKMMTNNALHYLERYIRYNIKSVFND